MDESQSVKATTCLTWEELEECGELDRKLRKMAADTSGYRQSQSYQLANTAVQQPRNGDFSHQPSPASTPPFRILKRQPNSDPCLTATNSQAVAAAKPVRTLEEREAAYAEARLRILGSAVASEPDSAPTTVPVPGTTNGRLKKTAGKQQPPQLHYNSTEWHGGVCVVNGTGCRR